MNNYASYCIKAYYTYFQKIFIISLLLILSSYGVSGQSGNLRPKIGLVLSGGGANGIAHVGVLKVMEEAGLKPDYISGVSMGSIIGGMYAIGYSADSLYLILKNLDWELSFSTIIPESKVVFPEKEHYNNSIIELPVSSKKVRLPSGLINGQQIENQMSYYAWPAATISDFSELPIPFMCLATDLRTGKLVRLTSGYLPDAMRASSSVPTVFTPVTIDSSILIDGGVLRNYPAEEVREMGADIVIGSYTGTPAMTDDQLQSLPGLVRQIAFMNSREDMVSQRKLTDVMIETQLKGFSPTVFTNVDTLVERGYQAALPYKEYFRRLADSLERISPGIPKKSILGENVHSFDRIEINGNSAYSDSQILGVLGISPGENVDSRTITEKIDLLYGKTWFEKVKYRIVPGNDSLILNIDCTEKSKAMLYGGLYYDNYIRSGLIFRTVIKDLLSPRSLIDFDAFIGQYYRYNVSMLQFVDRNQKLGFSMTLATDNTYLPMLEFDDEMGSCQNRNWMTGVHLSKYLGLNHLVIFSFNIEGNTFIPDFVTASQLKRITFNTYSGGLEYHINSLDNKNFPSKGTAMTVSVGTSKLVSGVIKTDYLKNTFTWREPGNFPFNRAYQFHAGIRNYFPLTHKLTMGIKGNAFLTINSEPGNPLYNVCYLGGVEGSARKIFPLTGFRLGEVTADKFAGFGMDMDLKLTTNMHATLRSDLYMVNEVRDGDEQSMLAGYALELAYMSIIGPIRIGFMQGFSSSERYYKSMKGYISIGYRF